MFVKHRYSLSAYTDLHLTCRLSKGQQINCFNTASSQAALLLHNRGTGQSPLSVQSHLTANCKLWSTCFSPCLNATQRPLLAKPLPELPHQLLKASSLPSGCPSHPLAFPLSTLLRVLSSTSRPSRTQRSLLVESLSLSTKQLRSRTVQLQMSMTLEMLGKTAPGLRPGLPWVQTMSLKLAQLKISPATQSWHLTQQITAGQQASLKTQHSRRLQMLLPATGHVCMPGHQQQLSTSPRLWFHVKLML